MAIKKEQAPTLVDVAREAGVSLKTASRVLNNSKNVSREKTDSIREAMKRLGYRPNELARGLKAQKSAAIGMIVPNLSDPFTANAVKAVQEVARANGYVVILASSGGYEDVERSEVQTLIGRQIDGLVISPTDSQHDTLSGVVPNGLPIATFDQLIHNGHFDSVTVTNRRSAQVATQHLLSHGWRRVVAVGARPHLYTCAERAAGYRAAMREASLPPRVCVVKHESLLTPEWIAKEVLKEQQSDAVFSMNWVCTMLMMRGLRELGLATGREMPLLSFDDFDLADMLTPSLSVVQQPAERLGYTAASLLFERLRGGRTEHRAMVLPTSLILRQSCGCR
jgi:LacI family transcriptional regulator